MRYIKRQTTSRSNLAGKGVHYSTTDEVILDSTNVVIVPKGTTAERPQALVDGMMRYNTDTEEFEVRQNGAWRNIRFKEPNRNPGIVQQNLGNGDSSATVFGPLNSGDPNFTGPVASQNILVFVENVFQIAETNYTIFQQPNGWYIRFGTPVPFGKPVTVLHNFDK